MTKKELQSILTDINTLRRELAECDEMKKTVYLNTPGGIRFQDTHNQQTGTPTENKIKRLEDLNDKYAETLEKYADRLIEMEDYLKTLPDLWAVGIIRMKACGKTWGEIGKMCGFSGEWARIKFDRLFR